MQRSDRGGMVLVTGASGNVGREVMRALALRGVTARAASRPFDFTDPATFATALRDVRAVFLMRPPAISNVRSTLIPFVDEARRRGVETIVFLSVAGAGKNWLVPHHAVETHLQSTGGFTILRPGFFAQNFSDAYRRDIVEDGRVYVPAGRGLVAFVDVRDVAEVAAAALIQPAAHARMAYTLTGPEPVGFEAAADLLSRTIGRNIRYERASIVGYAAHLRRRGRPLAQVAVQTVLHVGLRFGQAERVDPTLARLLGRPPRTLGEFVRDHAELWAAPAPPRS